VDAILASETIKSHLDGNYTYQNVLSRKLIPVLACRSHSAA